MTRKSASKRYVPIVKTGNNPGGSAHFVKYGLDDLLKFTAFLDKKWTGWRWFDIYSDKGENNGSQKARFKIKTDH